MSLREPRSRLQYEGVRTRFGALVLAVLLAAGNASAAPPGVRELGDRLKHGEDFRVRLSAALELGKSADPDALDPLLGALHDPNASVRTAAAAALKELGDPDAMPALLQVRLDRSELVRKQVRATIAALEAAKESEKENAPRPARLLVKLGAMKNRTAVKGQRIEAELERESRKKLDAMPGVRVMSTPADSGRDPQKEPLPVVMVTGHIQKLQASRDGADIVYSASVEYILHTMPDESIAAKVSGSASGTLTAEEAKDEGRAAELRHQVLGAAIASALRRAPRALLAAARL
jgi:hypothetical protein